MEHDNEEQIDYELVEWRDTGVFQLTHSGNVCTCPFQPVIPRPGPNGGMVASQNICNSGCPLAQVKERKWEAKSTETFFTIFCGGQPLERKVLVKKNSPIETVGSMHDAKILKIGK